MHKSLSVRTSTYLLAARSLALPSAFALFAGLSSGCTEPKADDEGSSEVSTTCGALFCDTTGEEEAGESGTMSGDGDGDGDGEAGTTDGSCTDNEDCGANQVCNTALDLCVPDCGSAEVVLAPAPPPVMLVLDKSGSMVSNSWDHDNDPVTADETRWATLHGVTDFILTNFEDRIDFGMQLFPAVGACPNGISSCYNSGACLVDAAPEVAVASGNGAAIIAAMPAVGSGSNDIKGGTPASDGVRNAITALNASTSEVDPAIILVTDGAANCQTGQVCSGLGNCDLLEQYDTDLPTVVSDALANDAIPTYVVGIDIIDQQLGTVDGDGTPDANPFTRLNEVAVAGGRPNVGVEQFYNATNEAELMAALDSIATEIVTCDVDLSLPPNMPVPPAQIDFVEFIIDGTQVPGPLTVSPEDCEAGTEDGWIWLVEGTSLRFCGTYCDDLKSTGEVDGIYNCPPAG